MFHGSRVGHADIPSLWGRRKWILLLEFVLCMIILNHYIVIYYFLFTLYYDFYIVLYILMLRTNYEERANKYCCLNLYYICLYWIILRYIIYDFYCVILIILYHILYDAHQLWGRRKRILCFSRPFFKLNWKNDIEWREPNCVAFVAYMYISAELNDSIGFVIRTAKGTSQWDKQARLIE